MMAQEKAMVLMDFVPLPARVLVAARALFVYLVKMLFPSGLSPFYPYSRNVFLLSPQYYVTLVLVIVLSAACLIIAKRQKLWLSIWSYYVVTLIPVLGIVQVGRQSMADRYTYLPSLGPFFIAGLLVAWVYWKTCTLRRSNQVTKLACTSTALCLFIFLACLTVKQIGIWNNTVGFWSYVILKESDVPFAYYGRGVVLFEMGRTDKALEDYDKAIELDSSYAKAYASRGLVFEKMGRFDKAIADYDKVIALNPSESQSYNNRGLVFEKMGRFDKAIQDYDRAIALNPSNSDLYYNRGNSYDEMGRFDKAIADYDKAITLNPRDSQSYNNRGLVFEKMGELGKAIADYDKAIALDASNSEAYNNLRAAREKKLLSSTKDGRTATRETSKHPVR
jgi:tetratricopeptide (TPR) repeat protein